MRGEVRREDGTALPLFCFMLHHQIALMRDLIEIFWTRLEHRG